MNATHLVLEFKYTESLNERALIQLLGYGLFYANAQKLKASDVDTFLLSSKNAASQDVAIFRLRRNVLSGRLQKSLCVVVRFATLLVLNELSDEPHNVVLKCFASRISEVKKTYNIIDQKNMPVSVKLSQLLMGLRAMKSRT